MRTQREQNIEQVAGIIYDGYFGPQQARRINETTGWGFDVRYDAEDYVSERDYTRRENVELCDADLAKAQRLAGEWLAL